MREWISEHWAQLVILLPVVIVVVGVTVWVGVHGFDADALAPEPVSDVDVVEIHSERFGVCELAVVQGGGGGPVNVVVLGCTHGGR